MGSSLPLYCKLSFASPTPHFPPHSVSSLGAPASYREISTRNALCLRNLTLDRLLTMPKGLWSWEEGRKRLKGASWAAQLWSSPFPFFFPTDERLVYCGKQKELFCHLRQRWPLSLSLRSVTSWPTSPSGVGCIGTFLYPHISFSRSGQCEKRQACKPAHLLDQSSS